MSEAKINIDVLLNPLLEKDNYKLEYGEKEIEKLKTIANEKEELFLNKNNFYYKEKILYNSLPNEYFQKLDSFSTNYISYKNYFRFEEDFDFINFKNLIEIRKRYLHYIEKKDKDEEKDSKSPEKEEKIDEKEKKEKDIKNEGIYILITSLNQMLENYKNENKEDLLIYYSIMEKIFTNIFNELELFQGRKESLKNLSKFEITLSECIDSFEKNILSKSQDKKIINILFQLQKLSLAINSCSIFLKILRLMKKSNIIFDNYNSIYNKYFKFNFIDILNANDIMSSESDEIQLDEETSFINFFTEGKYLYFCYGKNKIRLIKYNIEKKEKILEKTLKKYSDDICILNDKNRNKIILLSYIGVNFELLIINKKDLLEEKIIKIDLPEKNLKLTQIMNSLNYFYIIDKKKIYSLNLLKNDYTFKLFLEYDKIIPKNDSYYFLNDNFIILNNSDYIDLCKHKYYRINETTKSEGKRKYLENEKLYTLLIKKNKVLGLNISFFKSQKIINNDDMQVKINEIKEKSFKKIQKDFMFKKEVNEEKKIDVFKYYTHYKNDFDLILNLNDEENEKYKYKIDEKLCKDYYNFIYSSLIQFYYYSSDEYHKLKINVTNDIMLDNIKEIILESNDYIILFIYTNLLIQYEKSKRIDKEEINKQMEIIIKLCQKLSKENLSPFFFYILREIYKYKPDLVKLLDLSEILLNNAEKLPFDEIIYYLSLISLENNNNFFNLFKKFLEIERKIILSENKGISFDKEIYDEVCHNFLNYFLDINIYKFKDDNFLEKFEKMLEILVNSSIIDDMAQFIISSQRWFNDIKNTRFQFLNNIVFEQKSKLLNSIKNSATCKILFLFINIIIYKINDISKKNKKKVFDILKLLIKSIYIFSRSKEKNNEKNNFLMNEEIIIINSDNLEKNFNIMIPYAQNEYQIKDLNKVFINYDIESNYDFILEIGKNSLINKKPLDLSEMEFTLEENKNSYIKDNEKNENEYRQFKLKFSNYKNEESITNILTDIRKCIIYCIIQLNSKENKKELNYNLLNKEEFEFEKKIRDKKIKEIINHEFFNNISIIKYKDIIIDESDNYLDFDYKDIITSDKSKNLITEFKELSKEINSIFNKDNNSEENIINVNISINSFNKMILSNEKYINLINLIHQEFLKKNIWGSISDSLLKNIIINCFSIIVSDFNLIKDFEDLVKLNKDNKIFPDNKKLKLFISIYTKINNIKKIFSKKKHEFSLLNDKNNSEENLIEKYIQDINIKLAFILNNKIINKEKVRIKSIDDYISFLLEFITNEQLSLDLIINKMELLNEKAKSKEMALNFINKMLFISDKGPDIKDLINYANLIIKNGKNKLREIEKDLKGADSYLILNYKKQVYIFLMQILQKIKKDNKEYDISYYFALINSLFWSFESNDDYQFLKCSKFYEILFSSENKNIIYDLLYNYYYKNNVHINQENNNIYIISKDTLSKKVFELFKLMAFIAIEKLNSDEICDDTPLIKYIFDYIFNIFNRYIDDMDKLRKEIISSKDIINEEKLNDLLLVFYRCLLNQKSKEKISNILQKYYFNIFQNLYNIFIYSSAKNKIITLKIIDLLLFDYSIFLTAPFIQKNIENLLIFLKEKNVGLYNLLISKKVNHIDNILIEFLFNLILLLQQNIDNSINYINCTENNLSLSFLIIKILQNKLTKNENPKISEEIIKFIDLNYSNKKYIAIILQILGVELDYEYIGDEVEIIQNKEKGIILGYFNSIINEQKKKEDICYKYINYSKGINLCCINKEDISYIEYFKNPEFTLELINKNSIRKKIKNKLILTFEKNEKIFKNLIKNISNYEPKETYLILKYIKMVLLQEKITFDGDTISFLLKKSLDEDVLKFECRLINMENLEKIVISNICEINKNILEDIEEKKNVEEKDINTKLEEFFVDPQSPDILIEKKSLLYRFGEEHKFGCNFMYKRILNYDLFDEHIKFLKIFNTEKNCKSYKQNCILLTRDILNLEKIAPNIKYIIIPDISEDDIKKIKIATTPIIIVEVLEFKKIYENAFEGQSFEEAETLFLNSLQTDASALIDIPIEKIAEFTENQRDILLEIVNVEPKYERSEQKDNSQEIFMSDDSSDNKEDNNLMFNDNENDNIKTFCGKKIEEIDINLIYKKLTSQICRRIIIISKIIQKIKIESKNLKNIIKLLIYESQSAENKDYEICQIIKNFVIQTSSDNEYDIIKELIDLQFLENKKILIDDAESKEIKTENELLKLENLNNNMLLINMFFSAESAKKDKNNEILDKNFLFAFISLLIKQNIDSVLPFILKMFKHIENNINEYIDAIIKNKELLNNDKFREIYNFCENLIKVELYKGKKGDDNKFNEITYEKIELIFCIFNIECILKYKYGIDIGINYLKNFENSSLLNIHIIVSMLLSFSKENKINSEINYYNFIRLCYQKSLYKFLINGEQFTKPLKSFKFNYYDKTFNSNFVRNYQNIISKDLIQNIVNVSLVLKSYDESIINPDNCVFIYESEKCINLQDYIKKYDVINDKRILLISPNFTISYPYKNYHCYLYGAGSNEKNSLGIHNDSGLKYFSTPQKCIGLEDCKNIVDFKFGYFHTFVQTADQNLYTCGGDDGSSFKFKLEFPYFNKQTYFYSLSKENSGIKLIAANNFNSSILVTNNNKLFCCGKNNCYCLGNSIKEEGKEIDKPVIMPEFLPLIKELKYPYSVKEIACGYKSTLFLLEGGYAFTCGSQDFRQCGSKENVQFYKEYFPLYPPRGTLFNHVIAGEEFFLFLVNEINEKGYNKLYSLGQNEFGRSGTGELNTNYTLQRLEAVEDKDFMVISSRNENAAAISTEGILYTFGNNTSVALGLGDKENRYIPTKVSILEEDYICSNVGISQFHMVIIARNKKTGKRCIFTSGNNENKALLTCSDGDVKYDIPGKISFFEDNKPDEEPIMVALSRFQTHIMTIKCDLKNNINKEWEGFKCIKCTKNIKESLFFDFDIKNKTINYYCKECAEINNKNIFYVINTINDDTKKNLELILKNENIVNNLNLQFEPEENKYNCMNCNEEIKKNIYQSYSNENIILCDQCYISKCSLIEYPQIFISYDCSISPVKNIKNINIDKYVYLNIIKADKPYLEFDLYANYKKEYIIKELYNNKELRELYDKYWKLIDYNMLIEMRKLKEFYDTNKFDYLINNNEEKEEKKESKGETIEERMENMKNKNYEYLANIAGKSNKYLIYEIVEKLIELRDKTNIKNSNFNDLDLYIKNPKLYSLVFSLSNFINFEILKILSLAIKFPFNNNIFNKAVESSLELVSSQERIEIFMKNFEKERKEVNYEDKEITISRIKAINFYKKNILDKDNQYTVFSQLFRKTRTYPQENYLCKEKNRLFKIHLKGEGATDFSGAYNEIMSIISFELQSNHLDLFIKTPNNKNEIGTLRDKYIPNPKVKGQIKNDMLYFLGNLMLHSICTGNVLDLNLHPIFYKKLLNKEVDFSEIETLDKLSYKFIISLENIKDEQEFQEKYNDLFFAVHSSSDNSLIELIDNGQYKKVTFENLSEYINLYKKFLLTEYDAKISIIRSGIFDNLIKKCKKNFTSLITPQDLEELITGIPKLSIQTLRERTVYEPNEPYCELFQNFWKVLESFTEKEKSLYLKFVSGRTRLPNPGNNDFIHKIVKIDRENPDKYMPTSTTCYFTLGLPQYSSYEILNEKLKYAIHNCNSIDADFVPDDNEEPLSEII